MKVYVDTFETPFGLFSAAANESGALVATAFGDRAALKRRLSVFHVIAEKRKLASVRRQVSEYFAGGRRVFDLSLAAAGTPFQQEAWNALCAIPFGETRSYGQLARQLGRPAAARAIGRANATNPICLIVPCHRVIGARGELTGFAFGEEIKRRLLEHERRGTLPAASAAR